jgi:hypothetical protein
MARWSKVETEAASLHPQGWSRDPSDWRERLPALALSLTGCAIATYLALYQVNVLSNVWEPFFGAGSHIILKESPISHMLPVPDAALGAMVYLLEAISESIGGRQRWRDLPGAVFVTGAVAAGLGLAALVLVAAQALWFHAYCTLCLASAACSLAIAALVAPEVWAAAGYYRKAG